jgi:hypothetical protein
MSPLGLLVVTGIAVVVLVAFLSAAPERGLWYGATVLILYALGTRWMVTADHRVALWHLMNHDYEEAAERFRASFEWFSRSPSSAGPRRGTGTSPAPASTRRT